MILNNDCDQLNLCGQGPELEGVYSTSLTAERALQVASEHVARGTEDPLFMYLAFQVKNIPGINKSMKQ